MDFYSDFENLIRERVAAVGKTPVFTTAICKGTLWNLFLEGIDPAHRQYYNCHCCRHFIERFGGLVYITEEGETTPVLWNPSGVNSFFKKSVQLLFGYVSHSNVNGVFYHNELVWGTPATKEWTHLHGPCRGVFKADASVKMSEKLEEFKMLKNGLAYYDKEVIDTAVQLLNSDALYRSEKAAQFATWLQSIDRHNNNLIWKSVATAPTGYCHVRTSVLHTLLDDLLAKMEFPDIAKRWADKMDPLQYRRPTALPKMGAIVQAEKLFQEMNCASALKRRFATLDDVLEFEWKPTPSKSTAGLFGHLKDEIKPPKHSLKLPETFITWEKFKRTVLSIAESIQIHVPYKGNFYGLLTAVDPDAKPILQWDGLEGFPRNPVSWFVYAGESTADVWSLKTGWADVTAIFKTPCHWQKDSQNFNDQICFTISGCVNTYSTVGSCLFPEILKSEFHSVRSVIERHSKLSSVDRVDGESANGLMLHNSSPVSLKVKTKIGESRYKIDRID